MIKTVQSKGKFIKCKFEGCNRSKQNTPNKKSKRSERDYCKKHWYAQKWQRKWR